MIIIRISGGLGNQMFQYALGRTLAIRNEDIYKVDVGGFGKDERETPRTYELDIFNIKAKAARKDEICELNNTNLLKRVVNRLGAYWGPFMAEKTYCFDSKILKLGGNLYLYGFWQSFKYFADIEKIIRDDFTFKKQLRGRWKSLIGAIKAKNSVSVHVRRQDYVSNKEVKKVLGFCGLEYYVKAIDLIKKRVKNPYFVFFSDDVDWVRENFNEKNSFYVEGNAGEYDYEDMMLMSMCKHNIIANSSFSWWGAWLNENNGKIVISPKYWFNDGRNDNDLIPKGWIRL